MGKPLSWISKPAQKNVDLYCGFVEERVREEEERKKETDGKKREK